MRVLSVLAYACFAGSVMSSSLSSGRSHLLAPKALAFRTDHLELSPLLGANISVVADNLVDEVRKTSWRSPTGGINELPREIMAGLVVALATIPTSISYSTVVGINPIIGIWNSALVGLFVTMIGGAPGLIAGSAGVIALPMAKLVSTVGLPYMSAAIILSSVLQLLFGVFKLSYLQNVVTEPVIAGFMNALGIFLVQAQLKIFKTYTGAWLSGSALSYSLATTGLCFSIVKALPMLKLKLPVPPSLVGLLASSVVAHALGWTAHIKTLADKVGHENFVGGLAALPTFTGIPNVPINQATLGVIGATAVGTAIICIIETVLAMRIAGEKYRYKTPIFEKDDPDRAVVGMGLGNLIASLFGGFGGCGLIPNTLLNGTSGGLGYASGYAYALFIALAVVFGSPVLGKMPMAALAGLMMTVASTTFEWHETLHVVRHSLQDTQHALNLAALVATTVLCFQVDMGLGVAVGVLLAQLPTLGAKLKALVSTPQVVN